MKENEIVAGFMGLIFVTVGYFGTDEETDWQRENKEWFDSHYEFHDHSVGDYAVNVKENIIFCQDDLKYDTSWDCLMPVVEKIANIWNTTTSRKTLKECTPIYRALQNRLVLLEISGVHDLSVEFIKWYKTQNK